MTGFSFSQRVGLLERIPVMDTKSATSTVIENGEISEGQREEQRKFNLTTFSFILIVAVEYCTVLD